MFSDNTLVTLIAWCNRSNNASFVGSVSNLILIFHHHLAFLSCFLPFFPTRQSFTTTTHRTIWLGNSKESARGKCCIIPHQSTKNPQASSVWAVTHSHKRLQAENRFAVSKHSSRVVFEQQRLSFAENTVRATSLSHTRSKAGKANRKGRAYSRARLPQNVPPPSIPLVWIFTFPCSSFRESLQ